MAYTSANKANVFAEMLESQFTVIPEPYNELTNRMIHQSLQHTPLIDPFNPQNLNTPIKRDTENHRQNSWT